jgi:hypothetical protein
MSLPELYAEVYRLTNAICSECSPPFSCCELAGCAQAASWASHVYNVELKPIDDGNKLPYLSDKGCIVATEHRRLCTTWLCPQGLEKAPQRYKELLALIVREEVETLWKK